MKEHEEFMDETNGSQLNLIVGNKNYEFKNDDDYFQYALDNIQKSKNPNKVIFISSSNQAINLFNLLNDFNYNVIEIYNNDDIDNKIELFNNSNGEKNALICPIKLFSGLSISRDADFFIYKIPFPFFNNDIANDKRAKEAIINETLLTIKQAVSGIITKAKQVRNLYLLDKRVLSDKKINLKNIFLHTSYKLVIVFMPNA